MTCRSSIAAVKLLLIILVCNAPGCTHDSRTSALHVHTYQIVPVNVFIFVRLKCDVVKVGAGDPSESQR